MRGLQAHLVGASPELRLHGLVEGDLVCLHVRCHQGEDLPTGNKAHWLRILIKQGLCCKLRTNTGGLLQRILCFIMVIL